MKKAPLQIFFSLFMLCVFIHGSFMNYHFFQQFVSLFMSGKLGVSASIIATLIIFLLFATVQVLFLVSAVQIFRRESYVLLRWLLYASIPHVNCFGYVVYMFVFGPFLALTAGTTFDVTPFFLDYEFDFFDVQYMLTFSNAAQPIFQIGLNVVPFLWLMVLNGTLQKAVKNLFQFIKASRFSPVRT